MPLKIDAFQTALFVSVWTLLVEYMLSLNLASNNLRNGIKPLFNQKISYVLDMGGSNGRISCLGGCFGSELIGTIPMQELPQVIRIPDGQ